MHIEVFLSIAVDLRQVALCFHSLTYSDVRKAEVTRLRRKSRHLPRPTSRLQAIHPIAMLHHRIYLMLALA